MTTIILDPSVRQKVRAAIARRRRMPAAVADLIDAIEATSIDSPAVARDLLLKCRVEAEDLQQWEDLDHPVQDGYGRKMIHRGEGYELMAMTWAPGDFSAIHDHGSTEWGAVKYYGDAEHAIYDLQDGVLTTRERRTMSEYDVNEVDHDLIHQMGNRGDKPFMSLHLYGTDTNTESVTGGARLFDLLESRIQYTDGGVFYCLPESEIVGRSDGPVADKTTLIEHHRQMLSRIMRMADQGVRSNTLFIKAAALRHELALLLR